VTTTKHSFVRGETTKKNTLSSSFIVVAVVCIPCLFSETHALCDALYTTRIEMSISFGVAKQYFERAVEDARRDTHTTPVQHWQEGRLPYEMQVTPKEQRAALRAAYELMRETAATQDEHQQVSEARLVMREFRGPPDTNNPIAAFVVDGLNMLMRKRRIKKQMVRGRW